MSSSYSVLESLAERDRRVRREQNWKAVRAVGEWLVVALISGVLGAVIAFPYAIDMGKAQAERKAAQTAKPAFSCKTAKAISNLSICKGA